MKILPSWEGSIPNRTFIRVVLPSYFDFADEAEYKAYVEAAK